MGVLHATELRGQPLPLTLRPIQQFPDFGADGARLLKLYWAWRHSAPSLRFLIAAVSPGDAKALALRDCFTRKFRIDVAPVAERVVLTRYQTRYAWLGAPAVKQRVIFEPATATWILRYFVMHRGALMNAPRFAGWQYDTTV